MVEPAAARPDTRAPRAVLARVTADLERVAAGSAALKRALRAVQQTQLAYGGTPRGLRPTNLAATMRALASAQRALKSVNGSRLQRALARRSSRRLSAVGRSLASALLDRTVSARAPRRTIKAVRASLIRGNRLARAGNHAAAAGQYGKAVKLGSNGLAFDIARFEQNIRGFFDTQTIGYSYAIVRLGQLYSAKAFGLARSAADTAGGGTQHSPEREVNIASVTKTITAAAVLKLIKKNKMDIDESIEPWLPKQWQIPPSIQDLTFRDLMTQRSGLGANQVGQSTSLATLQAAIEQGINPADKTFVYQNANFGIFRVIIPALLGVDIYAHETKPADVVAAETYVNYLRTEVFDRNGELPDCKPGNEIYTGGTTLAYPFPDDGLRGRDPGDWTLGCGGGGLYLSAIELARFLARLRFTNEIIDPIRRKLMNDNFLGYWDPINPGYEFNDAGFGVYRSHGGDLSWGPRGIHTCAINYTIAIQAVVLINSEGGNYPYQCAALAQAFDAAWVAK